MKNFIACLPLVPISFDLTLLVKSHVFCLEPSSSIHIHLFSQLHTLVLVCGTAQSCDSTKFELTRNVTLNLASFPGSCVGGGGKKAWYTLYAHVPSSHGNLHTTLH